ncbi:MAG: hypothetical protein BM556_09035 [Bacteriovorax sp. MedPE-SWde]|nr:MAG: hypothetical protein BM556_09035 [Bacteriovorax sp. MedPE-SWde]
MKRSKSTLIVMCGGRGSRMGEKTKELPKPLVVVDGRPMLDHILRNLDRFISGDLVLATGYKAEAIDDFIKGREFNFNSLTLSNSGLNTSMLKRLYDVKDKLTPLNLVCYGDTFIDIDYVKLIKELEEDDGALATMVTGKIRNPFGIIKVDEEEGLVTSFEEKPLLNYYIGSFVFKKSAFDLIDQELLDLPDGEGLVLLFKKLVNLKKLKFYAHEGLNISFNTQDEHRVAEQHLRDYYTVEEG